MFPWTHRSIVTSLRRDEPALKTRGKAEVTGRFISKVGRLAGWPHRLRGGWRRVAADEGGASLVEYAILVALIAVVAILVVSLLGNRVAGILSELSSKL